MTDEELMGETAPINDPFCATRCQFHGITVFKFLFLVLVYIILATLGLAVAFSVEVITQ